ncbi:hypothetical protein COOONC_11727, partial [Cooperia oncophora]
MIAIGGFQILFQIFRHRLSKESWIVSKSGKKLAINSDGTLCLEPADVIIVEGILTFYDERIREKFTMKLFVDADADVRLARR